MRNALVCVLLLCVVGCGGSDNPIGPSPDEPFSETVTGSVLAFGTNVHALVIPRSGSMRLRLTWSAADVDLDLYLAPTTCTALYPMANCGILGASAAAAGTQETIDRIVSGGERFTVWVDNLHLTQAQNYSISITIS